MRSRCWLGDLIEEVHRRLSGYTSLLHRFAQFVGLGVPTCFLTIWKMQEDNHIVGVVSVSKDKTPMGTGSLTVRSASVKHFLPLLLLFSLRAEALSTLPDHQNWILMLEHAPPLSTLTRLNVKPFGREDVHRLVDSLLLQGGEAQELMAQAAPFSQWLFDETNGQPFFIAETLKALNDRKVLAPKPDGSWSIIDWSGLEKIMRDRSAQSMLISSRMRALIVSRLSSLSPSAAEMLMSAVVLGKELNFEHLYKVAGLEETQGLSALD